MIASYASRLGFLKSSMYILFWCSSLCTPITNIWNVDDKRKKVLNVCEVLGFSGGSNTDRKSILQAAEQSASGVQCTSPAVKHETHSCLAALETEVFEH